MTPMTSSLAEVTDDTLLRPALTMLGLEGMDEKKFLRLIAGRLYFNASLGTAIIQRLPGARRFDYQALMGGGPAAAPRAGLPTAPRKCRT